MYFKQSGSVLIIAMIFIAIITILVTSAITASILQTKMSVDHANLVLSQQLAETKLEEYERKISAGLRVPSAEVIFTDICGVTFYRIIAEANHGSTNSKIQSTFAEIGDISHCDPKPTVIDGRQSLRIITN